MKAIILAAGEGCRLKPFTNSIPKPMIPVGNKPIIQYVIEALVKNKIKNCVIIVGYKKERIMNYFDDGKKFNIKIKYVEQKHQVGTGHALIQAKKDFSEDLIVLAGDNIINGNLIAPLIEKKGTSILYTMSDTPSKYGVISVNDGHLVRIQEKPNEEIGKLISTGIYRFEKENLKELENFVEKGKTSITCYFNNLIKNGKEINAVKGTGYWHDAVYPWDLLTLNEISLKHINSNTNDLKNVIINGKVNIGTNSIIHPGSFIVGPVIIGEGCEIGPNTCIFPSTSIGDNVTIGTNCEIKNSIIMSNTKIQSKSTIVQSVLGEGNNIQMNFTTDYSNSIINNYETNKLYQVPNIGSFIGDGCNIGSNVIIDSGKIIGNNCEIRSMKRISENLNNNSIVV